ncbi:DUF4393 domain-containing protein [Pontibacter akesuensis]|uniref:DUF4393 domain-containing protein n=1 Tax=Pontibacter akesuensis TaxID=388950 RepID=A0A1I7KSG2_9BACT|nr:DUF4393 domain-containing protein [Pontibacter akesuensis]GHA80934.1 hypothetical protein GCM10007389_39320 [Pontibacter akesuensis]SFV00381.1 protein of unknown function [Pontibacter akesuensis]
MLDKFLDKIPTDKIYDELLQPSFKNVGEALGTLFSMGNLILLPLKFQEQKARMKFDANLKRYAKKLEASLAEDICEVPPYVGLPILEKLTYLDQHELSEAFINLLTKASTKATINLAHPSFISTLNNLCADEAKILFHYKYKESIPRLDLYIKKQHAAAQSPVLPVNSDITLLEGEQNYTPAQEVHTKVAWNLTGIEVFVKLDFPDNVDVYIENLEKLGIIALETEVLLKKDLATFKRLEQDIYQANILKSQQWVEELNQKHEDVDYALYNKKGYYYFTEYGKMFMKACIKELNEAGAPEQEP